MLVAVQLFVSGLYLPPVFKRDSIRVMSRIAPPDDHFAAGPYCRVTRSGRRRVGGAGSCPTVRAGIVSAAGIEEFERARRCSSPDDHLIAGPDCGVTASLSGGVGGVGSCPTIRAGIVSPARVQMPRSRDATPDDHFTASPHCCVITIGQMARWRCWWLSNCPCSDCICRRYSNSSRHIRPRRSFHCRSTLPYVRLGQMVRSAWSWLSSCRCSDCICHRC